MDVAIRDVPCLSAFESQRPLRHPAPAKAIKIREGPSYAPLRNLGTTPNLKKKNAALSEWKGHSRSNSRNSGAFSEQFAEWRSRPNLCENPILGATLGATPGIGWTPKFQPKFSELFFFQSWGDSRTPEPQDSPAPKRSLRGPPPTPWPLPQPIPP